MMNSRVEKFSRSLFHCSDLLRYLFFPPVRSAISSFLLFSLCPSFGIVLLPRSLAWASIGVSLRDSSVHSTDQIRVDARTYTYVVTIMYIYTTLLYTDWHCNVLRERKEVLFLRAVQCCSLSIAYVDQNYWKLPFPLFSHGTIILPVSSKTFVWLQLCSRHYLALLRAIV